MEGVATSLGWGEDRIREHFQWSPTVLATLEKDHIAGQDEALLDIYRKLRPGEPPTKESAQALLDNLFFKDKRYDLAKVGRYKVNKKLGLNAGKPITSSTLTEEDIVATIEYLVRLHAGEEEMIAGETIIASPSRSGSARSGSIVTNTKRTLRK